MLVGFILVYFAVWAILSLTMKVVKGIDTHYDF